MKNLFLAFTFLAAFSWCRAELPPSAYEARQKAATDLLQLQILRVNVEPGETDGVQKIEVLARVDSVTRTESDIKANDLITILYDVTHHQAGWVGPGEIPILTENESTIAYLNLIPDTKNFSPAAGRMSFSNF